MIVTISHERSPFVVGVERDGPPHAGEAWGWYLSFAKTPADSVGAFVRS